MSLTTTQVARQQFVTHSNVLRWIREEGLRATQGDNGRWSINPADLAEFIRKRESPEAVEELHERRTKHWRCDVMAGERRSVEALKEYVRVRRERAAMEATG